jgi:hypothetical protein
VAALAVPAGLAGAALFGVASTVVVILQPHSVLLSVGLSVAVAFGYALIAMWLCFALRRLGLLREGGEGADGEGWGRQAHGPNHPQPPPDGPQPPSDGPQLPSDGPDLWPELERELRAYLETHEREPVAG